MKFSTKLAWGTGWTIGGYGASQFLRFVTNVALTRLLAPELFGIMSIVTSVRIGVQLMTDVGISQNMIVSRHSEEPAFYNTAWTINLIRSLALFVVSLIVARPLADVYQINLLAAIFPIIGLLFVFEGLSSLARPLVQKKMQVARLNLFELAVDTVGFAALIAFALASPTIWALVLGTLAGAAARMIGTYFLVPGLRHRFYISREYARQIAGFSKWIFISSIALFFSMNFDRLYLGKAIPLELLGVYGVARALAEPLPMVVQRLSGMIVFPLIATSSATRSRQQLREQVGKVRLWFLLTVAFGLSVLAASADLCVWFLYDQRYQAAGWMACILIAGSWFSVICNLNESTLMGLGKPSYGAMANGAKMVWLLIGLPLGLKIFGLSGAVTVVAVSDFPRYVPILAGQIRSDFAFAKQDLIATMTAFGLICFWWWLRGISGLALR